MQREGPTVFVSSLTSYPIKRGAVLTFGNPPVGNIASLASVTEPEKIFCHSCDFSRPDTCVKPSATGRASKGEFLADRVAPAVAALRQFEAAQRPIEVRNGVQEKEGPMIVTRNFLLQSITTQVTEIK